MKRRRFRLTPVFLGLFALAALAAAPPAAETMAPTPEPVRSSVDPGSVAAPTTVATTSSEEKGDTIRFENGSRDTVYVLAVFGAAKCQDSKERQQLTLEPGGSGEVTSGGAPICWCSSTFGKVGSCESWSKAKPGKTVYIR